MYDLTTLKILEIEWTRKAQSSLYADDERNTYYTCAEQLHDALYRLETT